MEIIVAAITPEVRLCDCKYNTEKIISRISDLYNKGARIFVTSEMAITGASIGDYILQDALINAAADQVNRIVHFSLDIPDAVMFIGFPYATHDEDRPESMCAVISNGKVIKIVSGLDSKIIDIKVSNSVIKTGVLVGECNDYSKLEHGAELIVDMSSVDYNIITKNSPSKLRGGYIPDTFYIKTSPGRGESVAGKVYSGLKIIKGNGDIIASSGVDDETLTCSILFDNDSSDSALFYSYDNRPSSVRNDYVSCHLDDDFAFSRFPFLPQAEASRARICTEILKIQREALRAKLVHTGIKDVVLGLSGGLDSTLALISCVTTFDYMGLDRRGIHCISMPCFGTTERTRSNAEILAQAMMVSFKEIDITDSVISHLNDIDQCKDENGNFLVNVTYENAQARERTQVLMDIANSVNGLVIGTGDMSEAALGWCTYNGDHMSMYGINAGIPKTVIAPILTTYCKTIDNDIARREVERIINDIIDTPISPELTPAVALDISQKTEKLVGPYSLHDFFLYQFMEYHSSPEVIYERACKLFDEYERDEILKWEKVFYKRFISQQFKRNCAPESPKIFEFGIFPNNGFCAPSDGCSDVFINILDNC